MPRSALVDMCAMLRTLGHAKLVCEEVMLLSTLGGTVVSNLDGGVWSTLGYPAVSTHLCGLLQRMTVNCLMMAMRCVWLTQIGVLG